MTPRTDFQIYVGWDPREVDAYRVCVHSLRARASTPLDPRPLTLDSLVEAGLYTRPTERPNGALWDVISGAPMSTEFAISRFFVPYLAKRDRPSARYAVFCDCDFLWLADIDDLVASLDDSKALACVQHQYAPKDTVKMDGQAQTLYFRKNWSSLMIFNLRHPSNEKLTLDLLNGVPGRDLHRFCWLGDEELQALEPDWNWLEGASEITERPPRAVHFTRGGPWMPGWQDVAFADLWRREHALCAGKELDGP